jgi:hypothetical protein
VLRSALQILIIKRRDSHNFYIFTPKQTSTTTGHQSYYKIKVTLPVFSVLLYGWAGQQIVIRPDKKLELNK